MEWVQPPPILLKMSKRKHKKNYPKTFGLGSPPPILLKMSKRKPKKNYPKTFGFGLDPPPLLDNVQKEAAFFSGLLPLAGHTLSLYKYIYIYIHWSMSFLLSNHNDLCPFYYENTMISVHPIVHRPWSLPGWVAVHQRPSGQPPSHQPQVESSPPGQHVTLLDSLIVRWLDM